MEAKSEETKATDTSLNSSISSVEIEDDFPEEELKKAEEYKTKGNEAFKSKYYLFLLK